MHHCRWHKGRYPRVVDGSVTDAPVILVRLSAADTGEMLTLQRAAYVTEAQAHNDLTLPKSQSSHSFLPILIGCAVPTQLADQHATAGSAQPWDQPKRLVWHLAPLAWPSSRRWRCCRWRWDLPSDAGTTSALRERQRHHIRTLTHRQRQLCLLGITQPCGRSGRGRGFEQGGQFQFFAQGGADSGDEAGGQQRVAAEVKEVVVDVDPGHAQQVGEQLAQQSATYSARLGQRQYSDPLLARDRLATCSIFNSA